MDHEAVMCGVELVEVVGSVENLSDLYVVH